MTLEISQILHSSVIVKDTQTALSFYQGILGLTLDESRPDLGYAGAWLNVGQQQIHLLELPNPDIFTSMLFTPMSSVPWALMV